MNYWLLKTEPETYSWDDLIKQKKGIWDGVRNFQARSHLKKMKKGDLAFFYHTGDEKSVVGVVQITREAFPDPTDTAWSAVEIIPQKKLKKPISLAQIKADKRLQQMVLVRAARLSVQPVKSTEFEYIVAMTEK